MLVQCRLCAHHIDEQSAKDIFDQQNAELVLNVKVLTGILLVQSIDLPRSICSRCILDLNHSIAFRECCIKTNHQLLKEKGAYISESSDSDTNLSAVKRPAPQNVRSLVRARPPASSPSLRSVLATATGPKVSSIVRARIPNSIISSSSCVNRSSMEASEARLESETKAQPNLNSVATALLDSSSSESSRCSSPVRDCGSPTHSQSSVVTMLSDEGDQSPTPSVSAADKKSMSRRPKVAASLVCDQCGRSFDNSSNLKLHLVRHTGVKSFECPECDQKFFTNPLLQMHISVRHKGQKPWKCRFCSQGFRTGDARCRHERKEHYNTKFPCKVCGKSFITKSCLSKHEFLHTGLRPYRCEICDIGFPRNTQLKIHCKSKSHLKNLEDPKKKTIPQVLNSSNGEMESKEDEEFQDLDEIIYEDFDYIDEMIDEDVEATL
ncbi:zinc finger protein 177-like [Drosophila willistoni]|uniref:zinc finger protein 177-like n=1 Tax=Drosophila willistoni TaxID=7260 RepID=UPI000C26D1D5|nr:zinc finger protein 177-like [Drosophila willistoni]